MREKVQLSRACIILNVKFIRHACSSNFILATKVRLSHERSHSHVVRSPSMWCLSHWPSILLIHQESFLYLIPCFYFDLACASSNLIDMSVHGCKASYLILRVCLLAILIKLSTHLAKGSTSLIAMLWVISLTACSWDSSSNATLNCSPCQSKFLRE